MKLIVVTGGIRSGKSAFAEKLAMEQGKPVVYVATGVSCDREMEQRIRLHQQRRPADWRLLECPYDLPDAASLGEQERVILLDCLSTWISNRLLLVPEEEARDLVFTEELFLQLERWLNSMLETRHTMIIVSSEAGWGGVAMSRLGRWFQDVLGEANQKVAGRADTAYAVLSGIPWRIKG